MAGVGLRRKFIDIGANLTDGMFTGVYNGKLKHQPDLTEVLKRAWSGHVDKIIITGGSLAESKQGLTLAKTDERLFCTVGCHPTRCNEFEESGSPQKYLEDLTTLTTQNKDRVVAVGECGLDYDRLNFCPKETQKKYFEKQLHIAAETALPLFLHCRNSAADLVDILASHRDNLRGGVVHSFDGTTEEAKQIIDLNLYIGINGCSLKTESNLEMVSKVPCERLMIETDCPWCEIRPSHASSKYVTTTFPAVKKEKWEMGKMVKNRNEPVTIVHILEVLAAVRGEDPDELCETIYNNTHKLFFMDER